MVSLYSILLLTFCFVKSEGLFPQNFKLLKDENIFRDSAHSQRGHKHSSCTIISLSRAKSQTMIARIVPECKCSSCLNMQINSCRHKLLWWRGCGATECCTMYSVYRRMGSKALGSVPVQQRAQCLVPDAQSTVPVHSA